MPPQRGGSILENLDKAALQSAALCVLGWQVVRFEVALSARIDHLEDGACSMEAAEALFLSKPKVFKRSKWVASLG